MTCVLLGAGIWNYVFGTLLFVTALFLIMLILVQRGRGGGLAGALGGLGGQSAFGAKAGDLFTRITMVTATIWILLCIGAIMTLRSSDRFGGSQTGASGAPTSTGAGPAGTSSGGAPTKSPAKSPAKKESSQ